MLKIVLSVLAGLLVIGLAIALLFYAGIKTVAKATGASYKVRGDQVYYIGAMRGLGSRTSRQLVNVDTATFEVLSEGFAKDINQAYFAGITLPGSDGATFELLKHQFARDKSQAYFREKPLSKSPGSFKVLSKKYAHDAQVAFFQYDTLSGSDGSTFKLLKYDYAVDKNQVYRDSSILSKDAANFEFVARTDDALYSRDKSTVYRNGKALEGVDAASFEAIADEEYYKDKKAVYYNQRLIERADPKTFQVLREHYAKDKQHVFHREHTVEGADPKTFRLLKEGYARDDVHLFVRTRLLSKYPGSFQILDDQPFMLYVTDGHNIFISGIKVEGADAASFEILGDGYARDKHNAYYKRSIIVGAKAASFVAFNKFYSKDESRAYYQGEPMADAHAPSFEVHKDIDNEAKDRDGYFKSGRRSNHDYGW